MNSRIVMVGSALAGWTMLAMLDAAAKAGILLALGAMVALCMRKSSAANRHLVWFCALAGAFVLPFGFKILPQWRVLPSWMRWEEVPRLLIHHKPEDLSFSERSLNSEASTDIHESLESFRGQPKVPMMKTAARDETPVLRLPVKWFIGAWGIMACFMLLPILISTTVLRHKIKHATKVIDGPLVNALNRVKSDIGMIHTISLLLGNRGDMPMAWGIFQARLLLPAEANEWSSKRLRVVLLHEVSHLRRRDPLALLVAHLALALYWFNPLAWLAVWRLRVEQEAACDDAVLRHGVLPSDYAEEMLAASSHFQTGRFVSHAALTMARPSGLETRIAGILDASKNRHSLTRKLAILSLSLATLAAIPLAVLRADEPTQVLRGRILDRNGVVLAESPRAEVRNYPFKQLAAHRLGYLKPGGDESYSGVTGAELTHNAALAEGKDVTLTLDSQIQREVETVMRQAGVERGAVVVMDCTNGDLLANASFPAYDPNDFYPKLSKEKFTLIFKDKAAPILDRAVTAELPGSSFKLVAALAACRAGKAGETYECAGFVEYGKTRLGCWKWNMNRETHGELDLRDAITASCNCYFAQSANEVGIQALEETGHLLGFGELSGSEYPQENSGIFPGPLAAEKLGIQPKWTPFEIAMTSIGQGHSKATPLQLVALAAAMGNGEKIWVPRLTPDAPPQFRTDLPQQGWKTADLATLRSAMRDNVMKDRGIGAKARSEKIQIAGLSATAQTTKRGQKSSNAWFIGYAPADAPKYAIAILVEGGNSGGTVCGPIARDILEEICLGDPK